MATKYTRPKSYSKPITLFRYAKNADDSDWSKKPPKNLFYKSYKDHPLTRKAYLTANPSAGVMDDEAKEAKIGSRADYHSASQAFHMGKVDALTPPDSKPSESNSPESQHITHHFQAAQKHHEAKFYMANKEKYQNSLSQVLQHYNNMESHAKKHNFPIGAGHTRYVTK